MEVPLQSSRKQGFEADKKEKFEVLGLENRPSDRRWLIPPPKSRSPTSCKSIRNEDELPIRVTACSPGAPKPAPRARIRAA
jgi:hypothetical protein